MYVPASLKNDGLALEPFDMTGIYGGIKVKSLTVDLPGENTIS